MPRTKGPFNELLNAFIGGQVKGEVAWSTQYFYANLNVFFDSSLPLPQQLLKRVPFVEYLILRCDSIKRAQLDDILKCLDGYRLKCFVGYFPSWHFTDDFESLVVSFTRCINEFYFCGVFFSSIVKTTLAQCSGVGIFLKISTVLKCVG